MLSELRSCAASLGCSRSTLGVALGYSRHVQIFGADRIAISGSSGTFFGAASLQQCAANRCSAIMVLRCTLCRAVQRALLHSFLVFRRWVTELHSHLTVSSQVSTDPCIPVSAL